MSVIRACTILALVLGWYTACEGLSTEEIVLFGDSLSDNGNGLAGYVKYVLRTNQTYPEEPYYKGRWSNGPTWIEVAATRLGVKPEDYGAGGATTGSVPAQNPPLPVGFAGLTVSTQVLAPTLFQQLDMHFLSRNNTLSKSAVYIIFIGNNDYISILTQNTTVSAKTVTDNIQDAMGQLYSRGALKFLLVEMTDLTKHPAFAQPSTYGYYVTSSIPKMGAEIRQHNLALRQMAVSFPATHQGSTVSLFDFRAAFSQAMGNTSLGFTNTMQPCYDLTKSPKPNTLPTGSPNGTVCKDPDHYVFWDQFHPTRVMHSAIGDLFVNETSSSVFGVPSPKR